MISKPLRLLLSSVFVLSRVRTGIQATLAAAAAEGKLRGSGVTPRHPPPPMMNPPAPLGAHASGLNGLAAGSMPASSSSSGGMMTPSGMPTSNGSMMTPSGMPSSSGIMSSAMLSNGMTPSGLPTSASAQSMVAPPPRQVCRTCRGCENLYTSITACLNVHDSCVFCHSECFLLQLSPCLIFFAVMFQAHVCAMRGSLLVIVMAYLVLLLIIKICSSLYFCFGTGVPAQAVCSTLKVFSLFFLLCWFPHISGSQVLAYTFVE
jgi:hypothetical protein